MARPATRSPLLPRSRVGRPSLRGGSLWRRRCSAEDEPDIVEKLFAGIFGKKALQDPEPFGLKRIGEERGRQLFPATTTEIASPVESDTPEMACFRPLLAQTRLEKANLRLAYDAEVHGWNYGAFHQRVDGFGAAVVVARSPGGAVFGGYNPRGWIGLGENRDSNAAFLFTWTDGDTSKPAIKLPKVGGPGLAVIDKEAFGIRFGAEGLTIGLVPQDDPKKCKSRLGTYYERLPDGGRSLFAASEAKEKSVMLTELRIYVAVGEGEEWELDGIVWKTKWKESKKV